MEKIKGFGLLAAVAVAVVLALAPVAGGKIAHAGDIFALVNDEAVALYEREVAGEAILSDKPQAELERAAKELGVSVPKYKALVILRDLEGRVGIESSLGGLAKCGDFKLLARAKSAADKYLATQPEQRQEQLKRMFMELYFKSGRV